jgi:predicted amidohydrolase YtcJ
MKPTADLILENGRVTTLDPKHPEAKEVLIAGGRIAGVDNFRRNRARTRYESH